MYSSMEIYKNIIDRIRTSESTFVPIFKNKCRSQILSLVCNSPTQIRTGVKGSKGPHA